MRTRTLPRHARTGVTALGWRRPRPGEDPHRLYPIWPILGGDGRGEGDGDGSDDDGDGDQDGDDDAGKSDKDGDGDGDDGTDWKAEAEKWKAQSRKHEQRAKDNAAAAKERDKLKREGMSDVDKRVDEAVAAARAEERTKAGERVARSAFLAAAKGRLADPSAVADDVNLRKYVNDDGEVDDEAIGELVDRLAPKSGTDDDDTDGDDDRRDKRRRRRGGFDQGARGRNGGGKGKGGAVDGNELFKELLGREPHTASRS